MAKRARLLPLLTRTRRALGRVRSALQDVLVGATGADAYGNYLAHLRRHHPERVPLSRERFAAEDLSARWNGVRRCC